MDVLFILDFSGSADDYYNIVVGFAREAVSLLPVGILARVAVVSFSDQPVVDFYLNSYSNVIDVTHAMTFIPIGGTTNTQSALRLAGREVFTTVRGDRVGVDNKVVVVTDGRSNVEPEKTAMEAEQLRAQGMELFVVPIGDEPNMNEIIEMASDSKNHHVLHVESIDDVEQSANALVDRLCIG